MGGASCAVGVRDGGDQVVQDIELWGWKQNIKFLVLVSPTPGPNCPGPICLEPCMLVGSTRVELR